MKVSEWVFAAMPRKNHSVTNYWNKIFVFFVYCEEQFHCSFTANKHETTLKYYVFTSTEENKVQTIKTKENKLQKYTHTYPQYTSQYKNVVVDLFMALL